MTTTFRKQNLLPACAILGVTALGLASVLPATAPTMDESAQNVVERTPPPGMDWLNRPRPENVATSSIRAEGVFVGVVMPPDPDAPGKYQATVVAVPASGKSAGDFSGLVIEDPEGHRTQLKKGQVIAFTLAGGAAAAIWKVFDAKDHLLGKAEVPLKPPPQSPPTFQNDPVLLQNNQAFTLHGNFGENPSATQFRVNNRPASVIAIGPHSAVVACPDLGTTTGPVPVEVQSGDKTTTLHGQALAVTVKGPTVMRTNQPGTMDVAISGLQGMQGAKLEQEIKATVQNDTPNVVQLANHQTSYRTLLDPAKITADGTYTFQVPYAAAHPGNYRFTASARQGGFCCDISCAPCSGTWFCSSKGVVMCGFGNCGGACAGHHGGSACDKWFCSCAWRNCVCGGRDSCQTR